MINTSRNVALQGPTESPGTEKSSDTQAENTARWSIPAAERRGTERRNRSIDSLVNLVTALRWGTTAASLFFAAAIGVTAASIAAGSVLIAYATLRTFRPVEYRRRGWQSLVAILFELALTTGVIVATDCWDSPYIFTLFTPVIAAGFARGFWHAFRIGITGAFAVGLAAELMGFASGVRATSAWCGELLLTAVVASYGRRLHSRAEEFRALNLSQVWRLNEANGLLVNLNRLAHDLPASFDFAETVDRAIAQARELAPSDVCAVLTLDPVSPIWSVASAEGAVLSDSYTDTQLPRAVRAIAHQSLPQLVDVLSADYPGLSSTARSGLYVPLWAGPRQVGLLVLESNERARFGMRHASALRELAASIALTIDNARWFDRLRARGAAQERNRIARDLHDRVGQEIAYVAFELDRLYSRAQHLDDVQEITEDIGNLRNDARGIVKELRETLYDLRTDVDETHPFVDVLQTFLDRVTNRSGIHIVFENESERRLPLAQEREVWRIAQEAIINAERHADATAILVKWTIDAEGASLIVRDDGIGMPASDHSAEPVAERRPSYGIIGMRERAESIGALLHVTTDQSSGTTVQLRLGAKREEIIQESAGEPTRHA
jgi:signal transduction histidine kinase